MLSNTISISSFYTFYYLVSHGTPNYSFNMAKESDVYDFVHRFQTIQTQRETADALIKVSYRD